MIKIVIDGLIGSGKSTILKGLQKEGHKIEQQRVKEWTHLTEFYSDPKKFAFDLQKQVQKTYNDINSENANNKEEGYVFLESFSLASVYSFGKMLYEDGYLTDQEYEEVHRMVEKFRPSLYIWVDVDVETSMRRIAIRGREGEENITRSYLERLKEDYEAFMEKFQHHFPIFCINNNEDDEQLNVIKIIKDKFLKPIKFSIEGGPGCGKTSLGRKMKFSFVEQILTDSIKALLEERYSDRPGAVVKLQKSYVKSYSDEAKKTEVGQFNGWEGPLSLIHVFSKSALNRKEITNEEFKEIQRLYTNAGLPNIQDFKLIVWLRPSINQQLHRIKERKRKGEENITKEYLILLDKLYASFLMHIRDKVLIIDNTDLSTQEVERIIYNKLQEVYFN